MARSDGRQTLGEFIAELTAAYPPDWLVFDAEGLSVVDPAPYDEETSVGGDG